MIIYHNADEIKKAINNNIKIYADNKSYIVIKDKIGQYLIHFINSDYYIGLTWQDNKTLNGKVFFSE